MMMVVLMVAAMVVVSDEMSTNETECKIMLEMF